jgi:hypothetical protein
MFSLAGFALNDFLVLVPYSLSIRITHTSNMIMITFISTRPHMASLQFHLTSGPVRLRPVWDQHHWSQATKTEDQTAGPVPNSAATADQTDRGPDQRLDRTAGTIHISIQHVVLMFITGVPKIQYHFR